MRLNLLMTASALAASMIALSAASHAQNSAPQPVPFNDTIPAPVDMPYPGTISLKVDTSDTDRAIYRIEEQIPLAKTGPLALLFPKWLPGEHGPRGEIEKLAGLKLSVDGHPVDWVRDPEDVYAFHVNIPDGARTLTARYQFLSATATNQGPIVASSTMLRLQFASAVLYPAGYFVRDIPYSAAVTYPAGWQSFTALRPASSNGGVITYGTVPLDVLVDSPVLAGRYAKAVALSPKVMLDIVADNPQSISAATPDQLAKHRALVEQAVKTFGAQHYDHYDFLLSLSEELGGIGLEHHRSSEDGVDTEYFSKWDDGPGARNLLPHEFTHSWNGKFRRGFDLWTPDYRTPMRDSLLWVYEGQTQFWGYVLGARSGLYSKQDTLDALAAIAANLDISRGRDWRALEDTTNDPIITPRAPKAWTSWQRSEDYYNEGMLVWFETDAKLRELTHGAKGIDDFAKAFFGVRDGDYGELTYDFDTVANTLNGVAPYDWARFLHQRLFEHAAGAPLGGFTASGYKLVYTDQITPVIKQQQTKNKWLNLNYSAGMTVKTDGTVMAVIWDKPAFNAGVTVGSTIISVNGRAWSSDYARNALADTMASKAPIRLILRSGDSVREVSVEYSGGLLYPHFIKTGTAEGPVDLLLKPRP